MNKTMEEFKLAVLEGLYLRFLDKKIAELLARPIIK